MEALKQNHKKIFKVKFAKKLVFFVILAFIFDFFLFPFPILANDTISIQETGKITEEAAFFDNSEEFVQHLPENVEWEINYTSHHVITAYNSDILQTDATPCITANGFDLCNHGVEDSIAANFLRFGTKVRIPDLFGDKVFVVRDRMNQRYSNRVDVWMLEKQDAKQFGVKVAKIEVLE